MDFMNTSRQKKIVDKSCITIFDQDSIQINLFQNPVILEFDTILW